MFSLISISCKEKDIVIDDIRLNCVVEGKGKPCLVIGSSIYYPKTFSKALREELEMYFVDMRWFAPERGDLDIKDFSIDRIIKDIEQIRLALGLEKPILLGHSIHGTIAMEYAKKYPQNISSLVMIGSPNIYGNKEYNLATTEIWNTASSQRKELQTKNWQLLAAENNFSDAQMVIENYCAMSPKYWYDPSYNARWLWKDMTIQADLIQNLYGEIFSNYTMFENGQESPVPTFVALGKYDYVIPPSLWKKDQNISKLAIHFFEKSGHTPQLEESAAFDEVLLKWIKKN